jgi:hypothetical protein
MKPNPNVRPDEENLEQRPGETFWHWRARLHESPTFLREKAEKMPQPRRRKWLFDRADAIDRGEPVKRWHLADETGLEGK